MKRHHHRRCNQPQKPVDMWSAENHQSIIAYHEVGHAWAARWSGRTVLWVAMDTARCRENYRLIWEELDRSNCSGKVRAKGHFHPVADYAFTFAGDEAEKLLFRKHGYSDEDYSWNRTEHGSPEANGDDESILRQHEQVVSLFPGGVARLQKKVREELNRSWGPITQMVGSLLKHGVLILEPDCCELCVRGGYQANFGWAGLDAMSPNSTQTLTFRASTSSAKTRRNLHETC